MSIADIRSRFIRPSLDPQKLAHFLAVYDSGNFSTAAKENNVSQQAVSKSIAKLEEGLGVKLFERSSFGAEPTIFGHALARRAKVITAESRLAAAELTALRGSDKGYVRIGLGWSFLPRIAPALIEKFRERQPGVTLSITSGDSKTLYEKLLRGDVEFVASAPPVDMDVDIAIELQELFIDRDVLMMRKDHPLAGRQDISLQEYASQTWLMSMKLTEQWRHICSIFLSQGISPPENYVDLDSVLLLKSMLLKSDGITLLGKELINLGDEEKLFATIENTNFPIERTAYLATRRGSSLQPVAKSLRTELITASRRFVEPMLWTGPTVT
jgi:DNA-binding transcriptional LysR family regulator